MFITPSALLVAEDFMATFREIDMSIHSLLDSPPAQKVETTAEEILEKYKQSEAEQSETQGQFTVSLIVPPL